MKCSLIIDETFCFPLTVHPISLRPDIIKCLSNVFCYIYYCGSCVKFLVRSGVIRKTLPFAAENCEGCNLFENLLRIYSILVVSKAFNISVV